MEALQFAKNSNSVILADINPQCLAVAKRTLGIRNFSSLETLNIESEYPFFRTHHKIDLFYSNGVLHHTPKFREILLRVCEILDKNGEIILMLYSDIGWKIATNKTSLPKVNEDVRHSKHFDKFVRFFDSVGLYADWYNEEKLNHVVGDFLKIKNIKYITNDQRYLMVKLGKV